MEGWKSACMCCRAGWLSCLFLLFLCNFLFTNCWGYVTMYVGVKLVPTGWEVNYMSILRIFNGTCSAITIVLDGLEDTVIGAKDYANVVVDKDTVFGSDSFYVQEEGAWYGKWEQCDSGADLEVYKEYND